MFGPSAVTVALLVWTHRWPSPVPVLPVSVWVDGCVGGGCVGGWVCGCVGGWGVDGCVDVWVYENYCNKNVVVIQAAIVNGEIDLPLAYLE